MSDRASDRRRRAAELYRRYGPLVYGRCTRLLRDKEAARDMTQEVFVRAVRDLDVLEQRETALPWLYRVATNLCLNARRDSQRRAPDAEIPVLDMADTPEAAAYPDRALAQSVLEQFDDDTQTIAVGVLVDGMGHGELASVLGISTKTVARRLERFLERARELVLRSAS